MIEPASTSRLARGSLSKSLKSFGKSIRKSDAIDRIAQYCAAKNPSCGGRPEWRKRVQSAYYYACKKGIFNRDNGRLSVNQVITWVADRWPDLQHVLDFVPPPKKGRIVSATATSVAQALVSAKAAPTLNVRKSRDEAINAALKLNVEAAAARNEADRLEAENLDLRAFKDKVEERARRQKEGAQLAAPLRRKKTAS